MIQNYPKLIIEYDGENESYSYHYIDRNGNNAFGNKTFCYAKPFIHGRAFVKHNNHSNSFDIINENGASIFESLISKSIQGHSHVDHNDSISNMFHVLNIMECCAIFDINKRNEFSITAQKFYGNQKYFLLKFKLFHINNSVNDGINNPRFIHLFADWHENLPEISVSKKMSADDSDSLYHELFFYLNFEDFRFYGPFEDASIFSEGKAAVKPFGYNYGFLDEEFVFDYEHQYQECFPFTNGLSKVKQNNTYGFVDHLNNFVIPPIYDSATSFKFGFAIVGEFAKKDVNYQKIDPLVCKWNGRKGKPSNSNSFGLSLDIINSSGKPIASEITKIKATYISRPRHNNHGEIIFDINEFGIILCRQGMLYIEKAGGDFYFNKILHYEMNSYYSPKNSFKIEYDELFYSTEMDASYFDILNGNYPGFERDMFDEMNEAYKDADAERYFSNPGLAFDEPEDSWNID